MRPFRFLATAGGYPGFAELTRLARKFADLRERFGISSFLIDDLDALAPVVEELAGQ